MKLLMEKLRGGEAAAVPKDPAGLMPVDLQPVSSCLLQSFLPEQ
jgi:hypothetical protein